MRTGTSLGCAALSLVLLAGCSSTVSQTEPERLIAVENGVRVEAQALIDSVVGGAAVPINYEIENRRDHAIGIADIVPDTTYDESSATVTVTFGSEVPGSQLLPRIIVIAPGEHKTFSGKARFSVVSQAEARPRSLKVRVQYLDDIDSFKMLTGISERAVHDPALASKLFPLWVEHDQTLETNTIPIHWRPSQE